MKTPLQNLFLAASLFTACMGIAQPTLTAAGINPVVGDAFVDNNTDYVSPGAAGANQTWNLSTMTVSATNSYTAVNPSSTSNSTSFPGANVCETITSAGYYGYYKTSSSALQIMGNVAPSGTATVIMPYSNPEDLLHFPFTYTNSYTDTWATNFMSSGYMFYRKGTDSITADGYGTLTLPNGTFGNVTRVHFVQNYQDSANFGVPYIITYRNDEYMWYLNGNHYPIATIATLANSASGTPSQYGSYLSGIVGGIANENAITTSCNIFPNPASTNITLNLTLSENKKVEIKLFNSLGSQINVTVNAEGVQGSNNYNLDVTHLAQGIYFAQINLDGVLVSTKRFVISK
ncbi:MAG TPA: T9SS type A sorting domain-containing protein [Bacteroidia bacterium]|nr:T9SS type A sorting domain-containing protein [Bacteroidia bacterium]